MKRASIDIWVGIFVVLGVLALLFLSMRVGNLGGTKLQDPYSLQAHFDNIGGLKVRTPVKSAGVVVGRIESIALDPQNYQAVVSLNMDGRYRFPRDTFATINTSGLLGEQYIGLEPGGDEEVLAPGAEIRKTQSAVVLEKLISQFMFNTAEGGSSK
ncbi:MAG: outer membrane lipid asymmetry maintenance protein MlaD [Candidatus Dactylopiibacterium carminicum]|uniref:Outer membrane lipid asymmetry maintenance protein MlaD n=1 Tax=Candidatus Dactylopiibacterium carminicum TaxID=857335 RepID=A0A272ESI8_9RHOO|nr:outer membrane lipid asymmetry maintenance protein MlaD [Candidatus Dactylopiibacterium carminicum]KAF7599070.1 outer membrane lipid asymmetry maintenance protein MlaD [Candidatus Dactylopiibacterium carminicum]PAS93079.1 MAG: outer membrane lipid asymmetry maintenance protein MlaD [Candidatus Dactylopiibacterium carminicum]PAS96644.1 MAG: outer membrane lipid asymmetry maintenance protein MlaD [Candidatus Dactylopiibacterium carminicum]PAS99081.1 MAG: outer membrane lipid asymmetry maintena